MRNYISLALATTPSGRRLGSHCKHVGVPTRLRIGNGLRRKCSAVAGGEGARTKGAVSKGTIFQCACKNSKPIFFQSVAKRQRERTGRIAHCDEGPGFTAPPARIGGGGWGGEGGGGTRGWRGGVIVD